MERRIAALAFALAAAVSMLAQTETGTITGSVVDPGGRSIPKTQVQLTNQSTGDVRTTLTESSGDFVFTPVLPGKYTVSVIAPGFKQFQRTDLVLTASERLSAGVLALQVGSVSESITVVAETTPIQTTSAERSGLINDKQTAQLLTIGRDITSLLRVLPGVAGSDGSSSLGTFGMPTINGVHNEYNTATIDGVVGNTRGYNNLDTPPNLDAIAEVKVLSSNYQAEYGKAAGAVISVVTKSGTQQFHGTGYYYVRNEDFNANNFFNNLNGLPRPRYRYNTIGGNVGGPIYWPGKFNQNKNKLFFFFSQEYLPIKSPDGIKYYTVPTQLERQGNFSQTFDQTGKLIPIKDPLNGVAFPGNIVPANRINPATQALLKIFPQPNFTNTAVSGGNYNYITNTFADQPTSQSILRVDYNATDKWRMFFRGLNMAVNNNGYNSPANADAWLAPANYKTHNPNVAINVVYNATPTLVNELTLGTAFWTEDQILTPASLALLQKSTYGITLGQLYPQFNPLGLIPQMSFGGITNAAGGGPNGRFPLKDVVANFSATDGLTKVWGKHILKFGIDFQADQYLQEHTGGSFAGNFAFDKNTNNPFDSNYAYSNAILGYFSSYSEINNRPDYKPQSWTFEWYAQDQWRITKKLTLDIGVRFTDGLPQTIQNGSNFVPSLYSAAQAPVLYRPAKVNGQNVAVNPLTGQTYPVVYAGLYVPGTGNTANGTISVGSSPNYPSGLVYGTGVIPAPRIGFAYDPWGDGKTVIRGGFGIFMNARARTGQEGDMVSNPPNIFTLTEYYGNAATFVNAGTLLGPPSVGHANELHPKMPSVYNMSFGIQRKVGFGSVLDVAYVGTLARHLSDYVNINEVPYGAHFLPSSQSPVGGVLADNFYRPYPGYGSINYQTWGLTSSYHSLQTQLTRRFSRGLQFGAVWTYSKAMDYTDSYNGTIATYLNPRVWNYGPAGYDHRHNVTFNYLWDIPKASKLWNSPVSRWVFDNWQVSGITSFISGAPCPFGISGTTQCGTNVPSSSFTTVDGADIAGGGDGVRVVLTGNPNLSSSQRSFNQWFNTGVVHRPAQGTFGNSPFAPIVGPGISNWNMALFKNVPIKERYVFQLRVETYNTFNHTQFSAINTTPRFDAAGNQVNPSFGQVSATANPRYMQFAARFSF